MNFIYENQGHITYLSYVIAPDDIVDTMSLGMITNNNISGLAPSIFTQMDTAKYIKYDVSSKISVSQFFAGQVNKKRLIGVFKGIVDAMLSTEEYMLDVNSIILDLDYIFTDVSTCETALICLPIVCGDLGKRDLGAFFKNIMFKTQFDQTENCDHVAKIMNYLNSSPAFSLVEFKKLIELLDENSSSIQSHQPAIQVNQVQHSQPSVQQPQPTVQQPQPAVQQPQPVAYQQSQPSAQQAFVQLKNTQQNGNHVANQINTYVVPAPVAPSEQPIPEEKKESFFKRMFGSKDASKNAKPQKAEKKVKKATYVATPNPKSNKNVQLEFAVPGHQTPVQQSVPKTVQQQKQQPAQRPMNNSVTPQPQPQSPVNQMAYSQPQMPQGQSMNFGETTVLGGGSIGETTVLGAAPATQANPHLVRIKNNEKINLNKQIFNIGKERSFVDYFIGDNPAISRSHACIISRNGEFFVKDTNSTNHTYVNGTMIQSNVETKLSHSSKIKFANEEFEFKLY